MNVVKYLFLFHLRQLRKAVLLVVGMISFDPIYMSNPRPQVHTKSQLHDDADTSYLVMEVIFCHFL